MKLDEAHGTVEDDLGEKLQYVVFRIFFFLSMERAADMPHSCGVVEVGKYFPYFGATSWEDWG
jgi:hypothetical protein